MHALPFKPRLPVLRTEHEKQGASDHAHHMSPTKHVPPQHHQLSGSPPKTPPLEVHRVEPEVDDEPESHPLPQTDLQRIHSIRQHPLLDVEEDMLLDEDNEGT